jgi:Zn-dependent peptidase ImmA (M78 family)
MKAQDSSPRHDELDRLLSRFLRRFSFVARGNMERFAGSLARHLKAHQIPRDPLTVLPALGLDVSRALLQPAERAQTKATKQGYSILYSAHIQRPAARFALWREFFKILRAHHAFPTRLSAETAEELADRFAACMLMPRAEVLREAEKFRTNPEQIVAVLADRFGVSQIAMRRRLYELGILRPGSRAVHIQTSRDTSPREA